MVSLDQRRWLQWLLEAKKRFGVSILNYAVTSVHLIMTDVRGKEPFPRYSIDHGEDGAGIQPEEESKESLGEKGHREKKHHLTNGGENGKSKKRTREDAQSK